MLVGKVCGGLLMFCGCGLVQWRRTLGWKYFKFQFCSIIWVKNTFQSPFINATPHPPLNRFTHSLSIHVSCLSICPEERTKAVCPTIFTRSVLQSKERVDSSVLLESNRKSINGFVIRRLCVV